LDDYRRYYETGHDDWLGKMRERTSAIYKVVAGIAVNEMSDSEAAIHYAVMDLKMRGGEHIKTILDRRFVTSYYNIKQNGGEL
ncbi:MAG: hypothetical protein IJV16_05275, partial [Lachnospiraceae bacterium]|nr:hypothetical protein [Lachnospiraceae bacterium]